MNIDNAIINAVTDWFDKHQLWADIIPIIFLLSISLVVYVVMKIYVRRAFKKLTKKTETKIDDILIEAGLTRLLYLIPLIIISSFSYLFGNISENYEEAVQRITIGLMSLIILLTIDAILNAIIDIYNRRDSSERIPIKSHIQLIKIFIYVVGTIIIIGQLTGKSPLLILSGVGLFTAILLLVFRDSILSFIACIQITTNDLFKVGDWIEVPKYGADGDVTDIALHTVKVQNWDKTITVIPTYKLIEESFKNWRGMTKSGGRRIKRAIYIDISTIKFCDNEMLEHFKKMHLLKNSIQNKLDEIEKDNKKLNLDSNDPVNSRHLTNIGTFRAYVKAYLKNHPKIHTELTFLIRQLSPGEHGLPIEIYVFTNDTRWSNYEEIQSDIFDHLFAVVKEFDLKVFQNPTGSDFKELNMKQ